MRQTGIGMKEPGICIAWGLQKWGTCGGEAVGEYGKYAKHTDFSNSYRAVIVVVAAAVALASKSVPHILPRTFTWGALCAGSKP